MKRKDEHNPYFKHCSCPACKPVQPAQEVEPSTPHIPIMSLGECIKAESVAASGQAGSGPSLEDDAIAMLNAFNRPRESFERGDWTFGYDTVVGLLVCFAQSKMRPVSAPASQPSTKEVMTTDATHIANQSDKWSTAAIGAVSHAVSGAASPDEALSAPKAPAGQPDKIEQEMAGLRFRIHNLEGHNQYFFRCESAWCHPADKQFQNPALETFKEAVKLREAPAPAPLDLEKVAKEIDELADKWFHANPEFSRSVRGILARHLGNGEAVKRG